MTQKNIIDLIDEVSKETGYKPSTVCGRACGDPLLFERLRRRKVHDDKRRAKIVSFLHDWRRQALSSGASDHTQSEATPAE